MVKERSDLGSTVPRRQLGRELRRLRTEAGFTVEAAAEAIGRSAPTLWRMEKGLVLMRAGDVAGMCRVYGADDRTTEALMALAAETKNPGWWRSHNGAIPKWFDTYVGLESAAGQLRFFNDTAVPGLFQTRRYAEVTAGAAGPTATAKERDEWVAVRLERQKLLNRRKPPAPDIDVILGESVLPRGLPEAEATVEQLQHLLDVGRLPNVSIRVLPFAKSLANTTDGRFILLTFPPDRRGRTEPPVVYTDSLTGALYLTESAEIQAYNQVWEAMASAALSEDISRDMIKAEIERYQK